MKVSWKEIEKGCKELYKKLPKTKYDAIICISTGGLIPGKIISDLMDLPLGVVSSKRYKYRGKKVKEWKVNTNIQWHRRPVRRGGMPRIRNVLIIDDIICNGKTLQKVIQNIRNFTSVKEIDVCVLFDKVNEMKVDFKASNCYKYKEVKSWIVYPWERV